MTKSNLTRNCTWFVSCFITYKFQPNIVKYSNVGLLIKWWQLYETMKLVSIWDKNDFSRTFKNNSQNMVFFKNNSRNKKIQEQFKEFKNGWPPCSDFVCFYYCCLQIKIRTKRKGKINLGTKYNTIETNKSLTIRCFNWKFFFFIK